MTEPPFVFFHDLINPNTGNTYRADNLQIQHTIPIGTLVEAKWSEWHGDGACEKIHARLWVVKHHRDCDGTPLYAISRWRDPAFAMSVRDMHTGFDEQQLTPIPVTRELTDGIGSLEWPDE